MVQLQWILYKLKNPNFKDYLYKNSGNLKEELVQFVRYILGNNNIANNNNNNNNLLNDDSE